MKKELGFICSFKESSKNMNNIFVSFTELIGTKEECLKFKNKKDFKIEVIHEGDYSNIYLEYQEFISFISDSLDSFYEEELKSFKDFKFKKALELYFRSLDAKIKFYNYINFEEIYLKWFMNELNEKDKNKVIYILDSINKYMTNMQL
jgi:hypothetical protein